jgi:hypothetical protein
MRAQLEPREVANGVLNVHPTDPTTPGASPQRRADRQTSRKTTNTKIDEVPLER